MDFKVWLEDEDDPVAAWKAMRRTAGWADPQARPAAGLPPQLVDQLRDGLKMGGAVPDGVARALDLGGKNYSLVADSLLVAGRAYPFYREKRAGRPTGRFMFVPGFPLDSLLRALSGAE